MRCPGIVVLKLEPFTTFSEELPPKMTDILQVMDLIVNGPLKAHRVKTT